ncbi:MAG: hypothetical protein ACOCVE_01135 [Desulfovermiculus sp.]
MSSNRTIDNPQYREHKQLAVQAMGQNTQSFQAIQDQIEQVHS